MRRCAETDMFGGFSCLDVVVQGLGNFGKAKRKGRDPPVIQYEYLTESHLLFSLLHSLATVIATSSTVSMKLDGLIQKLFI